MNLPLTYAQVIYTAAEKATRDAPHWSFKRCLHYVITASLITSHDDITRFRQFAAAARYMAQNHCCAWHALAMTQDTRCFCAACEAEERRHAHIQ